MDSAKWAQPQTPGPIGERRKIANGVNGREATPHEGVNTSTLIASQKLECAGNTMHSSAPESEQQSALLRLPIELRRLIYSLVLPHTTTFDVRFQRSIDPPPKSEYNLTFVRQKNGDGGWRMQRTLPRDDRETGNDIVWRRGSTSLLAVSRQIHEETADMLYGDNTFVVDVRFDAINFRYRWRTANNLTPNRTYQFLDHFSQRNLLRIKNYIVNVESVDDYTGMIKYNCGGRGLPAGIRSKVRELVDLLAAVSQLHRLQIHLIDGTISRVKFPSGRVHRVQDESNYAQTQTVLEPFKALYGVRKAQVSGVSDEYAEALAKSMMSPRGALPV
jgi:hypothetical protein